MATNLKDLKIRLIVDSKGAVIGLKNAKGEILDIGTASTATSVKGRKLSKTFSDMKPAFIGAAVIIGGVTVALSKAIIRAGDAQETWSKFDAVFKESAADTRAWIDDFSGAVQRSRTDIADWSAALQDTFIPLGFTRDGAAELSKSLVELTVDVASFQNKNDADVLKNFQAAIIGEGEAVRKFGIILNQTTLDQELLNMGIEGGIKVATEQEKVQARVNILFAGTADAHGDAIRTAGSFNNQMKGTKAAFDDLVISVGQHFLPLGSEVVVIFGEWARAADLWIKPIIEAKTKLELLEDELERNLAAQDKNIDMTIRLGGATKEMTEDLNGLLQGEQDIRREIDEVTESAKAQTAILEEEEEIIDEIVESWDELDDSMAATNKEIEKNSEALQKLLDKQIPLDDLTIQMTRSFDSFTDSMARSIVGGGGLGEIFSDLIDEMGAMIIKARILVPLMEAITGTGDDSTDKNKDKLGIAEGATAGFAIGGIPGAVIGGLAGLFFHEGGKFKVAGPPGADVPVGFIAKAGEEVEIKTVAQQRSGGGINLTLNFNIGPLTDAGMVRDVVAPLLTKDAKLLVNELALR